MKFSIYVLPIVVGATAGMVLMSLGEMCTGAIYHITRGSDVSSTIDRMKALPVPACLFLLVGYAIGSFIAGLISTLLSKRTSAIPAIMVGIVLTLAGLYNATHVPHPLWFSIINFLVYLPFAYLGFRISRQNTPAGSE